MLGKSDNSWRKNLRAHSIPLGRRIPPPVPPIIHRVAYVVDGEQGNAKSLVLEVWGLASDADLPTRVGQGRKGLLPAVKLSARGLGYDTSTAGEL